MHFGQDDTISFLFQQLIQQCIGGLLLNLTLEQFKEVEGKTQKCDKAWLGSKIVGTSHKLHIPVDDENLVRLKCWYYCRSSESGCVLVPDM